MNKPKRLNCIAIMIFIFLIAGWMTPADGASWTSSAQMSKAPQPGPTQPENNRSAPTASPKVEGPKENQPLSLSLSKCLQDALRLNHDVLLAKEALAQSEEKIDQARSSMLPYLGAEATSSRLDEDIKFSFGPLSLTVIDRDNYRAGAVVRQPLFAGGRLDAMRKAATFSRDATAREVTSIEEEIVFHVTRAYWTVQVAEAYKKVATEAVDLLKAHEHDVSLLVKTGECATIDLLRTRTGLSHAQKELNRAQNAVDLSQSALKYLLRIPPRTPLRLTDPLIQPAKSDCDLASCTERALAKRPELSSLDAKILAAKQIIRAAKGEYLPTIALEGRYEYMKGDMRDLSGGAHWTIGAGAQMPLWNWGQTAAKVREAESQLKQLDILRAKTADHILLEVREAFFNLENAEKNIEVTQNALGTAREAYRHAKLRFREGEGTNTEVLDARTDLSRAESDHRQALFECNVALAALQRATGLIQAKRSESEIHQSKLQRLSNP